MHNKWSLNIGKASGIRVFIHWTFIILLAWIFLMQSRTGHWINQGLLGTTFILALFASVVLHEFWHSLTAMCYGIQKKGITIYPIGGIANLESMPEKSSQELQLAFAGPAVNLFIAQWPLITRGQSGSVIAKSYKIRIWVLKCPVAERSKRIYKN